MLGMDEPGRIIRSMGVALWCGAAAAAMVVCRFIRIGHARRWFTEGAVALIAAVLLGLLATAMDFGGWNELDPRTAAFAFFGAMAAIGFFRTIDPVPPTQPGGPS
jgi:hypothetical protein